MCKAAAPSSNVSNLGFVKILNPVLFVILNSEFLILHSNPAPEQVFRQDTCSPYLVHRNYQSKTMRLDYSDSQTEKDGVKQQNTPSGDNDTFYRGDAGGGSFIS